VNNKDHSPVFQSDGGKKKTKFQFGGGSAISGKSAEVVENEANAAKNSDWRTQMGTGRDLRAQSSGAVGLGEESEVSD